jgi:hypothetical protein
MTRYILHGGYPTKAPDGGKVFFETLCADVADKNHIVLLDCLFATPPEEWAEKAAADQVLIDRYVPSGKVTVDIAQPALFAEQLEAADVLYIRGGNLERLLNILNDCGDWQAKLPNKTVAGTSAGTYALSSYYFMQRLPGMVGEGLGLVPVKSIVHYRAPDYPHNIDWDTGDAVMTKYAPELPLITLREGEFQVCNDDW